MPEVLQMIPLSDHGRAMSAAKRIAHDKALSIEDQAYVAYAFFHSCFDALIQATFKDKATYEAAFMKLVRDVQATGIPGAQANALSAAWAMKTIQGMEIDVKPRGSGAS